MLDNLKFKLDKIPKKSGVYLWKDKIGNVIYVGKAKNLFNRTHQYFLNNINAKTNELVDNIYDVDFIVSKNDNDALILEFNLINKYKPKFNILLKENNNYPYIVLTNELNPRLIYTRNYKKFKGKYFGPLASNTMNKYSIYNLLQRLFPLRKCSSLPKKSCLYYDMKMCLAPCVNKIGKNEYDIIIKQINDFFSGNNRQILLTLKNKEKIESKNLNYEQAQKYLELIKAINSLKDNVRVNVQLNSNQKIDIVGYFIKDNYLTIMIHSYIKGKLLEVNKQITEMYSDVNELLSSYLNQYYQNNLNKPSYLYIRDKIELINDIAIINPVKGKFSELISNANVNAEQYFKSNYLVYQKQKQNNELAYEELKKLLNVDNLSLIHAFDMSSLFHKDKIGVMIGLENGTFNKKLYRKFIIKNDSSQGDTQYMYEVATRQYKRMVNEQQSLPNLIIVDGGINQINAIILALKTLSLDKIIPVIGLSKNKMHKTDSIVLSNNHKIALEKKSGLYFYLFNIQEEVHRFAINFNRSKRKIK
ncbi:MAG: excinuclease ABC subunit UvrC [Mycoplasmataceae bacterium]|nr:excinuclease ABC subunit UvrC [Mycoplasmataceae bacterium]